MTAATPQILIVEDEEPIRKFLRVSLANKGYRCLEAATVEDGIQRAAEYQPELVILDLGLPDHDGMEFIHRLRQWSKVPIIVLSARGSEPDKIRALDAGADDYLTKPFGVGELAARVRVSLRHTIESTSDEPVFTVGRLRVDLTHRRVFVSDVEAHLTPNEYKLLTVMVGHAGKVVTHRQLLKEVWGPDGVDQNQYLRVYVGQLRRKLEADPARPRYLLTEPGVGYRLAAE